MMDIDIKKIRRDGGTQSRADIDDDVVEEYADAMLEGVVFPPVTLFYDGKSYWLADGFHRVAAAEEAKLSVISADVRQGSQRDAILHSVGVNSNHGLRRTNDDKRRAVEVLLRDAEWRSWSDRQIAKQAGVDHKTVGKWRSELVQSGEIPQSVIPTLMHMQMPEGEEKTDLGVGHIYSFEISEDPDIEAARQVAIKALEKWADGNLDVCLSIGAFSAHDGVFYRIGKGTLINSQKEAHDVGESQVAVALSSNNGMGIYRFDARQLQGWIDERAAFLKKPETISALYNLMNGTYYVSYELEKKSIRLGLATRFQQKTKITPSGRAMVEAYIAQSPKLMIEHEIRLQAGLRGDLGSAIGLIEMIYKSQKKSRDWVVIAPNWNNELQRLWLKSWAAKGFLIEESRECISTYSPYSSKEKGVGFYIVSNAGSDFIGLPMLESPESVPGWPYHIDAETFVFPDATFALKVGDVVKRNNKIGRVIELSDWPSFKVNIANQSWPETWYENKTTLIEVDDKKPDPMALAELDEQTMDVWDAAQQLLICVQEWQSDENDQPQGMNANLGALESLASLMQWVSDTYSGQRLKLEMPQELKEVSG